MSKSESLIFSIPKTLERPRANDDLQTTDSDATLIISRAHSFFREPRNFEPSRGIWVFTAELGHGIRLFAAEFDVFHSNNYFFTKKDLKVAL